MTQGSADRSWQICEAVVRHVTYNGHLRLELQDNERKIYAFFHCPEAVTYPGRKHLVILFIASSILFFRR